MVKHKLAYLGLLVISWLLMRLYLYRATAVLFYTLLGFPAALFVLFRIAARKTEITVELPRPVVKKGEPVCLRVNVQKKSRVPAGTLMLRLRQRNCVDGRWKKKKLLLPGAKGESFEFYAQTGSCSQFVLSVRRAKIYDISGIFSKRVPVGAGAREKEVTVLPLCFELGGQPARPNPNVMIESEVYSGTKGGDDASEIFDIRDYKPGDRFNRIHWKLTEKTDRLMVKEFGLPVDCSVLIFLELGCYADKEEFLKYRDALYSALYSLSERLTADGQIHYIAWNAGAGANQKRKIACSEDFYETIGLLLREPAGRREENRTAQYLAEYRNDQYTNIFYLSAAKHPQEGALLMEEFRKSAWLTLLVLDGHEAMREAARALSGDVAVAYLHPERLEEELGSVFCREGSF